MDNDKGMRPVYLGDRITVRTVRGMKGNIIGRLPDGRAVLFDRESPYLSMLARWCEKELIWTTLKP